MPRPLRRLALFAATLVSAACASAGGAAADGSADSFVFFNNNSINQADVYVLSGGGARQRIGTVSPGRRERLRLRSGALGGSRTVEIQARALASSSAPRTGPLTFAPGESLEVTLSADGRVLSALPVRAP